MCVCVFSDISGCAWGHFSHLNQRTPENAIERIAMLKHGVNDIRDFYKSNLDFLSQLK